MLVEKLVVLVGSFLAARRAAWTALAAAALVGCDDSTAVSLDIHKADGVASEVYELRIFVGVEHHAELYDPAWRVAATLDDDIARQTLGGELGAGVFRLVLRPGDALDADQPFTFAVGGYKTGQAKPVVFARSTAPIGFVDGEARTIDVPLETVRDASHGVTSTGCAWWNDTADRAKRDAIAPLDDGDCDGFMEGDDRAGGCRLDCDDSAPSVHPGAMEICLNGIDENCCDDNDGQLDLDGDGFTTCGGGRRDCVDGPRGGVGVETVFGDSLPPEAIHPDAVEVCDGVDNDCNATCDEDFDGDLDGYFNCARPIDGIARWVGVHHLDPERSVCVAAALDCADDDPVGGIAADQIFPGAIDARCDGVDQDCDGTCDQQLVGVDADRDGFDACATAPDYVSEAPQCARGEDEDCGGDASPLAYPGGAERCDGIDFDCDGTRFPEASPCFAMASEGEPTACRLGTRVCADAGDAPGFGACVIDGPSIAIPAGYCQVSCDPELDAVQCLPVDLVCSIGFPSGGGVDAATACDSPIAAWPLSEGTGACSYRLVGGLEQGEWRVALVSPGGVEGATATGCGSSLRVVSTAAGAEARQVLVLGDDGPQVFRLERRDGCGESDTMRCAPP